MQGQGAEGVKTRFGYFLPQEPGIGGEVVSDNGPLLLCYEAGDALSDAEARTLQEGLMVCPPVAAHAQLLVLIREPDLRRLGGCLLDDGVEGGVQQLVQVKG